MDSIIVYFKRLYCYNKVLFYLILSFTLLQLALTVKKGVLFSPWFKFGMYSDVFKIKNTYRINKVDNLKGSNFTAQEWDKIHWTLAQYQLHEKSDSVYENGVKPLFKGIYLPNTQKNIYFFPVDSIDFSKWYNAYLSNMLGESTRDFQIQTNTYNWDDGIFKKVN